MSEVEPRRTVGARFSLGQLLTLTALIALGLAVGATYLKNRSLNQQRDELLAVSSQLQISNMDELASVELPRIASDFHSWLVHVPEGVDYDLRLGIGAASGNDIPPVVGSVRIPAGQHRVTLHAGDSISEGFRYEVYVDGVRSIEKVMGSAWMPRGWSSASGISWPHELKLSPAPLQLAGQNYQQQHDFGNGMVFYGHGDAYLTRLGYRLWMDRSDRTYPPVTPFIGLADDRQYFGIGLRDGLRFLSTDSIVHWKFTRPQLETTEPVLRLELEFFSQDGRVFSSQNRSFKSWEVRRTADGTEPLQWPADPSQTTRTAFLHAVSRTDDGPEPVVEMKWDAARPDEVGIRLVETLANHPIDRWRIRVLDGSHHLWRELKIGNRPWIAPDEALNTPDNQGGVRRSSRPSARSVKLDWGDESAAEVHLQWRAKEDLPLQVLQGSDSSYAGIGLYQGLPMQVGIRIPAPLKPSLAVEVADQYPAIRGTALPGGSVFNVIQLEFAAEHDWIWLSAPAKETDASAATVEGSH